MTRQTLHRLGDGIEKAVRAGGVVFSDVERRVNKIE